MKNDNNASLLNHNSSGFDKKGRCYKKDMDCTSMSNALIANYNMQQGETKFWQKNIIITCANF